MRFNSYQNQVDAQLEKLQAVGLDVSELEINSKKIIICRDIDAKGRGEKEYAYKTQEKVLNNGDIGLSTWYRGRSGNKGTFLTQSPKPDGHTNFKAKTRASVSSMEAASNERQAAQDAISKKAYGIWINAKQTGVSDYLKRKGVGSYGIRFTESTEYGGTAIVPLVNEYRLLMNVEFLNGIARDGKNKIVLGDGSGDGNYKGLFHIVGEPKDCFDIGISESYVTAATCYELTQIPTVCAISSCNLLEVTKIIRRQYPRSRIILFADNDRHLVEKGRENIGIKAATDAAAAAGLNSIVIAPDFEDIAPAKNATDWNDLVIHRGFDITIEQILRLIAIHPTIHVAPQFCGHVFTEPPLDQPAEGKLIHLIRLTNPEHYALLQAAQKK